MEKVSIVIPAYNSAATIKKCLDSLMSQDYQNLELIVVDDASTDNTLEKALKYPVKIISSDENRGAGHCRNLGVENANSEFIIFVDSDVVVPKKGISAIIQTLREEKDALAVGCAYSENSQNLNFISEFKNIDLAYRGYFGSKYQKYAGTFFLAMKKSTFQGAGGFLPYFSGATVEDIELCYRISKGQKVIFSNKNIRVHHLKRYTLLSMLKTDFLRVIGMMKIIKKYKSTYKANVEISIAPIINLFLPMLILLSIAVEIIFKVRWLSLMTISAFLINNFGFLLFLLRKRGLIFSIKSLFILFIEYIVVGFSTFISYFITPVDY